MEPKTPLDRMVNLLGDLLNSLGMNGTRLRWRWQNYRTARAEAAEERRVRFRTVTGKHKMCPSCRSLIPSSATMCASCGTTVEHVRGPGPSRLIEWLFPGVSVMTASVITANILVFALMALTAGFDTPRGGGIGALFRLGGFTSQALARFGWGYGPWIVYLGEYWRLLTPLFIHAGLLHILFNCYVLLQIGKLMEEEFGASRTWVIYLLSGLFGGVASNFLRPLLFGVNVPYVGASGAVFGLIGLAMVYGWRRGGPYGSTLMRSMIQWTLYVFLFGFVAGIGDHFAHAGGLLAGAALGLIVPAGPGGTSRSWRLAAAVGVGLCIWAFIMAGLHGPAALQRF